MTIQSLSERELRQLQAEFQGHIKDLRTFDELIAALSILDKLTDVKGAALIFFEDHDGYTQLLGPVREVSYLIAKALKAGIFATGHLKLISDTATLVESAGLRPLLEKLSTLTGHELLAANGERAVSRLVMALKDLHQHGERDSRPEIDKLRSIARLADAIWIDGMKGSAFVAELARQCECSERHLYRHIAAMRKLPEFKSSPWLNAAKSVNTRKKSKREDIARNAKC